MQDNQQVLAAFLAEVKPTQQLWALQDKKSEDWVVLDSLGYEETEVMPLWSNQALANKHCTEEWAEYIAAPISLADWLEFWVEDLLADNIILGINWQGQEDDLEMGLPELTESFVDIEDLKA